MRHESLWLVPIRAVLIIYFSLIEAGICSISGRLLYA
jgi:hypothetical protein